MIPQQASSRTLLAGVAGLAGVAALAGLLGSRVGPAVAALAPLLLGEMLWLQAARPRPRLATTFLVGLGAASLSLAVLTVSESTAGLVVSLAAMATASVSYAVGLFPRVPWANFRVAAAIAGVLGGAVVTAMAFRAPAPVLVGGVLAGAIAAFLTVPATVLGRIPTAGALALTVPPAVVVMHPIAGTLDRPLLTVLALLALLGGHTALTLGAMRASEPEAREREEAAPLVSIWDHLRAST